jgi:hypothetical protein
VQLVQQYHAINLDLSSIEKTAEVQPLSAQEEQKANSDITQSNDLIISIDNIVSTLEQEQSELQLQQSQAQHQATCSQLASDLAHQIALSGGTFSSSANRAMDLQLLQAGCITQQQYCLDAVNGGWSCN